MQDRQPKSIRKPAESVEHVKQGECVQDGQAEPIRKPADSLEHAGLQRLKGELNRLGHVAVTHSIFRTTDKSKTRARTAEAKAKPKAKAKSAAQAGRSCESQGRVREAAACSSWA